jgi:hypothetical protein
MRTGGTSTGTLPRNFRQTCRNVNLLVSRLLSMQTMPAMSLHPGRIVDASHAPNVWSVVKNTAIPELMLLAIHSIVVVISFPIDIATEVLQRQQLLTNHSAHQLTISQRNALGRFVHVTTVSAKVASTRFCSQDCRIIVRSQQKNVRHKGNRCRCIVNTFSVANKL